MYSDNNKISESLQKKEVGDWYSYEAIDKLKCQYNMIIGERSNGKTYGALKKIIENYVSRGEKGAYIRRYKEDYRGKRGDALFESIEKDGLINELTDGLYDGVKYQSGRWYLSKFDEKTQKKIIGDDPFCYGFAISDMEHDKSTSYPDVTIIVFDEFLTRGFYLQNEFVLFMNTLSTIIRHRNNVTIYMLGNTVNKFAPYFVEMGLKHVGSMEKGQIDVYTYGSSKLRVAVEYCASPKKEGKKSDIYFAFDNPSLQLITGGAWEIDLYPHCPVDYERRNIEFCFFIKFNESLLQGEVVVVDNNSFIYIHRKSTPIKDPDEDLIFSMEWDPRPNYVRGIDKSDLKCVQIIRKYFRYDKVFYQDNEVGEEVRNFLQESKRA
ncbi:MAG: phage DNA encapsidation protein [Methanobrevibacter sp.]|nr:phage DNA encapsidation protein [Methanobrevibacter sp.]